MLVGRIVSLPALSVMLKQGGQDSRSDRLGGLVLTELRAWQARQASGTGRATQRDSSNGAFALALDFDFALGIVTRRAETREAGLGEQSE